MKLLWDMQFPLCQLVCFAVDKYNVMIEWDSHVHVWQAIRQGNNNWHPVTSKHGEFSHHKGQK